MQVPGVPVAEATARDFIQVRAALVRRLGGANEALVWCRIYYRCGEPYSTHDDAEGNRWWPVTYPELAEETGLSSNQVRHALAKLEAAGYVATAQLRLGGNYDQTRAYRPLVQQPQMHLAPGTDEAVTGHSSHLGTVTDVPFTQTLKTSNTRPPSTEVEVLTPGAEHAQALCEHLRAAIVANGSKPPTITAEWLTQARLLVDRDERTPDQVHRAIEWCQADTFWRANVLSMPTLRKRYDQLRLAAEREKAERKAAGVMEAGRSAHDELLRRQAARQEQQPPWTPSKQIS